jgi:orotate phosphoribosyltransferase-like protein
MENLKVLRFYGYPVIHSPDTLKWNVQKIAEYLKPRYPDNNLQFIGTGTSGAMILTAISLLPEYQAATFCLVKKEGEHSHRSSLSPDFSHQCPAVVVDDEISTGMTMHRIATSLHEELRKMVEVVAVNKEYNFKGDWRLLFPNLKLIIT